MTPGQAVNKAILTKDNPQGDVFFGVDNTLLSRALDNGLFHVVRGEGRWTRSCPTYRARRGQAPGHARSTPATSASTTTRRTSPSKKLTPPETFDDLIKPAYKDLLVTENAATSSPGLGFLLGTRRQVRRRRLAGLLEEAEGQRREGRRRLGAGVQRGVLRVRRRQEGQGRPAARRLVRLQPARRGALRRPAARRGPDRGRDRHLLPADRVRRPARAARRTARAARRCSTS